MSINLLLEKTVISVQISEGGMALKFGIDDGTSVIAKCDPDSDADKWAGEIVAPEMGMPLTIAAVSNLWAFQRAFAVRADLTSFEMAESE